MAWQVHGIVKNSQDVDYFMAPIAPCTEHDDVSAFATLACNMQGEQSPGNIVSRFYADDFRASSQRLQCLGKRLCVNACLGFAKLLQRPVENSLNIRLSRRRKTDRPC